MQNFIISQKPLVLKLDSQHYRLQQLNLLSCVNIVNLVMAGDQGVNCKSKDITYEIISTHALFVCM